MPRKNPRSQAQLKADEIYNQRRRAKRYIARLEKELSNLGTRSRQAAQSYIESLKNQIAGSYSKRNATDEERSATAKAQRTLEQVVTPDVRSNAQARRNAVFQRELNLGATGNETSLGSALKSQVYVKTFYRATQSIWDGLPKSERNAAILAYFDTDSLEEAFYKVLRKNRKIVNAVNALRRGEVETLSEYFGNDSDYSDSITSPDYLDYVVME